MSSPGGHARQWAQQGGSLKLVDGLMDQSDARRPRPDGGAAGMSDSFLEGAAMLDVALEVARIEVCAPNRFVDSTKLGES